MKECVVGKFKRIKYDQETDQMEFTIEVTDPLFKKKLLREFHLKGKLKVKDQCLIYEDEDADV